MRHTCKLANSVSLPLALAVVLASGAATSVAQEGYETPPVLAVGDVLPDVLPETELYRLDTDVANDGTTNQFDIFSIRGPYTVSGNELVRERLHEIAVIDRLEAVKKTEAYADGLKGAAKGTAQSFKTLATQPVETISNIPKGVGRFFGNAYRATKTERRGEYQEAAYKEIIGFSGVKRQLAFRTGVDPYSSNQPLQEALSDVAWAAYAGGMTVPAVSFAVAPAIIRTPVMCGNATVAVSELVRDESPESLQKINSQKLIEVGASEVQIERLLTNRWYSPRRATILAEALHGMRDVDGIAGYLPPATDAASEEEAFFMQRSAELLDALHEGQSPLKALHMAGALPIAESKDGKLVAAFAIDYLVWTQRVDDATAAIRADLPARLKDTELTLWLAGKASERAKAELKKRGFVVQEDALKRLFGEE